MTKEILNSGKLASTETEFYSIPPDRKMLDCESLALCEEDVCVSVCVCVCVCVHENEPLHSYPSSPSLPVEQVVKHNQQC